MFLSFNYTSTLEEIYNVGSICHIHGIQNSDIFFGHGNDEDYTEYYLSHYIGAEDELRELDVRLRKDTAKAIQVNKPFFELMQDRVKNIYSYGFSFSDVDLPYIQEICKCVYTKSSI